MKSDQPTWLNILAALVVISGLVSLITEWAPAWILFMITTLICGVCLIHFDRKQRAQLK